ncbi:fluoride efflux transporter FluC [Woeseia oceani]|uniref:fluoride efflux transporter FluC n=1 Tax=Woeseia oceani TaxID=1548547 RepID=UPI0009F6119F|nr:CrcB family protein [Woeseia oceani]
MNLTALLFVGGGGALGAMSRYGLTILLSRFGGLPFGTFLSNLLGCLFMGVVLQWFAESDWVAGTALEHEPHRLLLAVGFCGSFTTLSALVYEVSGMLQRDELLTAFGYLLATLGGGFLFFYVGILLVRLLSA